MLDRLDELGQRAWLDFYDRKKALYGDDAGRKQYLTNDASVRHKFYKAFRDIATICLQSGFDVTDYVFTCFQLVEHDLRYVTPRDFASQKMADAYASYKKTYGDESETSWATQSAELRGNAARLVPRVYAEAREILLDSQMPFTSWFRVFYYEKTDAQALDMYGDLAWAELKVDRRLRRFLRRLRPANMDALENRCGYFGDIENIPGVINAG